ncbi:MAG: hypothetical protein ACXV5E_08520 [Halobacteriota archaeon]
MTSENPPSIDRLSLFREASLPVGSAFSIFQGVLLVLLGFLLYGVFLGGIPLNAPGQLGLLLVLTSLNVLVLGSVVGLQFRRTWIIVIIGIVFAATGIISIISPSGIMAGVIALLLGVQNILTGVLFLAFNLAIPIMRGASSPADQPAEVPPLVKNLGKRIGLVAVVLQILSILFGINMLAQGLLPSLLGLVGYVILFPLIIVILGLLLLYMTYLNQKLQTYVTQMLQQTS